MPAGATYTTLATTTLSSSQSSVTFSSISGAYTDLILVFAGTATTGNNYIALQFNSDTGANYSYVALAGNGSSPTSSGSSNNNDAYVSNGSPVTSTQNNSIIQIQNYSNSTTYKTLLARSNNSGLETGATISSWRSTAAITSITVKINTNNFASGSTFSLYGIAAA